VHGTSTAGLGHGDARIARSRESRFPTLWPTSLNHLINGKPTTVTKATKPGTESKVLRFTHDPVNESNGDVGPAIERRTGDRPEQGPERLLDLAPSRSETSGTIVKCRVLLDVTTILSTAKYRSCCVFGNPLEGPTPGTCQVSTSVPLTWIFVFPIHQVVLTIHSLPVCSRARGPKRYEPRP
jgi:hypothetical protein